jgi:hypothetical protein
VGEREGGEEERKRKREGGHLISSKLAADGMCWVISSKSPYGSTCARGGSQVECGERL